MTEKQTRCPNCASVYKVSVTQLTVAQGMVCCPKCSHNFNALIHLQNSQPAQPKIDPETVVQSQAQNLITTKRQIETNVLDIFNRKIENSNIDLLTYLNNLNYFNTEPVSALPNLNLSEDILLNNHDDHSTKQHGWLYYTLWGIGNIALIVVFAFQILWFNPKLMHDSPALNKMFNYACGMLTCKTQNDQYKYLSFEKVKLKQTSKNETRFSGVLINRHENSILLPSIKVVLKDQGEVTTDITLKPQDYLVDSLKTIQRIPSNSPFKFEFSIPKSKNSFDDYSLEIVQP